MLDFLRRLFAGSAASSSVPRTNPARLFDRNLAATLMRRGARRFKRESRWLDDTYPHDEVMLDPSNSAEMAEAMRGHYGHSDAPASNPMQSDNPGRAIVENMLRRRRD